MTVHRLSDEGVPDGANAFVELGIGRCGESLRAVAVENRTTGEYTNLLIKLGFIEHLSYRSGPAVDPTNGHDCRSPAAVG